MSQALANIKVLDLSQVLVGPFCTMMLADLGAEVIKIERPKIGDTTRAWGPPFVHGQSAYFLSANRNKKSLAVNLKDKRGADLVFSLARKSDVMIQNFRPGVIERLGLGYSALRKKNPKLIYCSLSAFGKDGPSADLPGFDAMIQAMGGLMSITGDPNGSPAKVGVAIVDILAGLYALTGILSALFSRNISGGGQHVDIALMDAAVASLANQAQNYLVTGTPPERLGNAHPNIVPYQTFDTKDGHVMVAVGNDPQFQRLCEVLGVPNLATDQTYATNADRVENRKKLVSVLEKIFVAHPTDHWVTACKKADVPVGPINDLAQVYTDPQVLHRKMITEVQHPALGLLKLVANPVKLSDTPAQVTAPPPLLGQHTEEILRDELLLDKEEIEVLITDGVVAPSKLPKNVKT